MIVTKSLVLLTLLSLLSPTLSTIPSTGTKSFEEIRSKLGDKAFKISLSKGISLSTPDYTARLADLSKLPALAAADVQTLVADATIKPGKTFLRHYHPRSAEIVLVTKGDILVRFEFEGFGGKVVQNLVKEGEFTVIPQGLIHDAVCKSKKECKFVAVFKTADPGLVALDEI